MSYKHTLKIIREEVSKKDIRKSEAWKKKYSHILDIDLEKGGWDAVKGMAVAGALAYGASQMDKTPTQERTPASADQGYQAAQQAPQKDDHGSKIQKLHQNHFMQYATGSKMLGPDKTHKVIEGHPELKEKYGHLLKDPYGTAQEMKRNEELRNDVHSKFFNYLYGKFDGNINHVAHAWKYGSKATSKHLKSGKNIKENPWVQRFFKY